MKVPNTINIKILSHNAKGCIKTSTAHKVNKVPNMKKALKNNLELPL
jgi:hypothetical protein